VSKEASSRRPAPSVTDAVGVCSVSEWTVLLSLGLVGPLLVGSKAFVVGVFPGTVRDDEEDRSGTNPETAQSGTGG